MVIPEVYEKHLEELQSLWQQRRELLFSPELTLGQLRAWERRIAEHLDGLLVPGEAMVPVAGQALSADDPGVVFAAAFVLLQWNRQSAAELVLEALLEAEAEPREAICEAMCHGPIERIEGRLHEAVASNPVPVAVAAAEVLAFHGRLDPKTNRLAEFFADEDPAVRRKAWRIAAILDSAGP
jgi:hypothetical protein